MISGAVRWTLAAAALVAGLAAALSVNDPSAQPAWAVASLALATVLLALTLHERLRHRRWTVAVPEGDPLVLLREGFRSGPLGRQGLVAAIASLERSFGGSVASPVTPDEERRLVAAPPEEFRAWVRARLDALEAGT